jgi:hypothetical protein
MSATIFSNGRIPSILSVGNGTGSTPTVVYNFIGNQAFTELTNGAYVAYTSQLGDWDDAVLLAAINTGRPVEVVSELTLSADTGPTSLTLNTYIDNDGDLGTNCVVQCAAQTTGTGGFRLHSTLQVQLVGGTVQLLSYDTYINFVDLNSVAIKYSNANINGTSAPIGVIDGKLYIAPNVTMNSVDAISVFINQVRVTIL